MIHGIIARELARHFLRHLQEEQEKSSALIDAVRFDGRTARDINGGLMERIRADFPGIRDADVPEFNFFRKWTLLNQFHLAYEDFAYEAYNLIFYERITCIKNWSADSVRLFHEHAIGVFRKFDTGQEGFSISFFIRSENNMREILRDIVGGVPGIEADAAWKIVFEQSKAYQETVNEFFEGLLKAALKRSDELLHNILPAQAAEELKARGRIEPVLIDSATVLFTDFKGFSAAAERMSPTELLAELDECFSIFDDIIGHHGLEKIKTIGDSFMCAGGLPDQNRTHAVDAALAALQMRDAMACLMAERRGRGLPFWEVRIGFHTGPLVAGVIAKKKFSYDIWGDTVNTASRMESSGVPGQVNISGPSYARLRRLFLCEYRGFVPAKNKGELGMYFLQGLKHQFREKRDPSRPNGLFYRIYEKIKEDGISPNGRILLDRRPRAVR